jgi:CRP-like cAMP-binding protein
VNLSRNGLFQQLPLAALAPLQAACEPVALRAGQVLSKASDADPLVYFLTSATVALLVQGDGDTSLAVGLVGPGSAVGLAHALDTPSEPLLWQVQTPGQACQLPASVLRELLHQHPAMLVAISHHLWTLVAHIATVAAAAQSQDIATRLAGWLVLSAQQAQSTSLYLTHDHLAHMLGVRRVSITLAAGALREQGLLAYSRGHVHILDWTGLLRAAKTRS